MKRLLLATAILAACSATLATAILAACSATLANPVATDQRGNSVTLSDQPCTNTSVVAHLKSRGVTEEAIARAMKSADLVYEGKQFAACYLIHEDHVDLLDEENDSITVPGKRVRGRHAR